MLETSDFVHAARGLRPQLELMEGAHEGKVADSVTVAFSHVIDETVAKALNRSVIESGGAKLPIVVGDNHS